MKKKNRKKTLFSIILAIAIFGTYSYSTKSSLTSKQKKIQEMYQEKYLEPGFLGGFINWGYWQDTDIDTVSINERIEASKNLYRKIFSAANITEKDSVLEVGCGKGKGLELLSKEFEPTKLVGLDLNSRFISQAQQNNKGSNIYFLNGDACNFQYKNQFSKIICVEASQHFLDYDSFLLSSYESLTSNGSITITGFFSCNENNIEGLRNNIKTIKDDIDIIRSVDNVKQKLYDIGYKNIRVVSIGDHVIPQYENWLKQVNYENMWAKDWNIAYEQGQIDYYIITAEKA